MEDTLREYLNCGFGSAIIVLILVLMEDTLRVENEDNIDLEGALS